LVGQGAPPARPRPIWCCECCERERHAHSRKRQSGRRGMAEVRDGPVAQSSVQNACVHTIPAWRRTTLIWQGQCMCAGRFFRLAAGAAGRRVAAQPRPPPEGWFKMFVHENHAGKAGKIVLINTT